MLSAQRPRGRNCGVRSEKLQNKETLITGSQSVKVALPVDAMISNIIIVIIAAEVMIAMGD